MPRPAATDPADTRRRLVEAASAAFAGQGAEPTSLREVAREAGVTIAVVHYHFGNKEGLRNACVDAARDGLREEFAPLRGILEDLRGSARKFGASRAETGRTLDAAVRSAIRAVRRRRAPLRLLMRDLSEKGELDAAWSRDTLAPFLRETAVLLAPHLGIPASDVRLRLQSLVALVVRQALSTPRELAILSGLPPREGKQALELQEEHLVWLARRMFMEE